MTPKNFKTLRKKLSLTQAEMAKYLGGYSIRAIQSWEAGARKIPQGVAKILEIRFEEI